MPPYCELGATRAVDTFRVIDDYLRENPNEVIVLILEDHVDAADAVDVLKKSGLGRHALQWDPGDPLPTLREMIQRRRNVLVLAENEGGAEPWYVPAYEAMEETPYRFDSRGDFSCEQNRGVEGNPLFLVNHWVTLTAPDPLDAADVNRSEVLLDRVEECEEERERRPNIIAVDFYTQGDLLDVVAELKRERLTRPLAAGRADCRGGRHGRSRGPDGRIWRANSALRQDRSLAFCCSNSASLRRRLLRSASLLSSTAVPPAEEPSDVGT